MQLREGRGSGGGALGQDLCGAARTVCMMVHAGTRAGAGGRRGWPLRLEYE